MRTKGRFKIILANMKQEEVLNFIWLYDQYVQSLQDDEFPINIEQFHETLYQQLIAVR